MGNTGSQTGHISQRPSPEEQWVHSFPRTQPRLNHQLKVLPERDARQKLRPTNNGEILHSGGTISGRQNRLPLEVNNQLPPRGYKEHSPPVKTYFSNERDPLHKSRTQAALHRPNASQKALQEQMKSFASEPDLRYACPPTVQNVKEKKSKKKYKAPPPPQNFRMSEKLEWEENSSDADFPTRKPRLFKTRAETKKNSSHVNKPSNVEYNEANSQPKNEPYANLRQKRLSLPELKLATNDDFQRELKEATKRLRHIQVDSKSATNYEPVKEKLKTLDHNVNKTENVRKKLKDMVEVDDNKNIIHCVRGEASGKESTTPENSPNLVMKDMKPREQPKTFYFGMDEPMRNKDVVDHFASTIHQINKIPNSSESDISSDMDSDENNVSKIGIDLQLRPILPKKPLEIPRFSPAAAWRLLSTVENLETTHTTTTEDTPVFIEERIEKFSRPPPPSIQAGQRSTHDKSGDSGISGDDAIPTACYDDNPENGIIIPGPTTSYVNTQERVSWTPQQDLEDDSSMEECPKNKSMLQKSKIPSGPHLFSLSLPRDNQLASYMVEKTNPQYSGLQKLKRSVSGVLNNLSNNKKDVVQANLTDEDSVNWFLSKSAPNSLSNGFHSLEVRKSQDSDQMYPSGINKTSRVMYLPEADNNANGDGNREEDTENSRPDYHNAKYKLSVYSKSCEDITTEVKAAPEALQDLPVNDDFPWKPTRKSKKFTFQSTIRQIEKKRLSDKLSREAERREKKRLRELEAMQKVEEEFQKKRAREKASIRQQLRLYCMDDDAAWSSLPPNLEIKDEIRPEPDGVSSSTTSSSPIPEIKPSDTKHFLKYNSPEVKIDNKVRTPATQELSEYRQIQRDYKEYRGSMKYSSDVKYPKQTTVHPQVTCNMPKAKGTKVGGGNYRKDFAFGVKSTMSAGSTYSEDSQNNSQVYHNRYAPITRYTDL